MQAGFAGVIDDMLVQLVKTLELVLYSANVRKEIFFGFKVKVGLDVRVRISTAVVELKCTCKKDGKNGGLVILGKI